jgi:head-tail adaptor
MAKAKSCIRGQRPPPYTHTLVLQRPATNPTEEASGQIDWGNDDNWTVVGRIRARFKSGPGGESSKADTMQMRQMHAIQTWTLFTPATGSTRSMDPTWRLLFGTRQLNITSSFVIDETGHEVQISVTERR